MQGMLSTEEHGAMQSATAIRLLQRRCCGVGEGLKKRTEAFITHLCKLQLQALSSIIHNTPLNTVCGWTYELTQTVDVTADSYGFHDGFIDGSTGA
ncbi:hypothetical protein MHYP_G00196990 [Metynnis hypsauchen]